MNVREEVLSQLLSELKRNFNEGNHEHVSEQESAVCDLLNVSYDFEHHDRLFVAYYLDAITSEQLIGGVSE